MSKYRVFMYTNKGRQYLKDSSSMRYTDDPSEAAFFEQCEAKDVAELASKNQGEYHMIEVHMPEVGMGGFIQIGSDRYACTVVKVITPKRVVVQRDTAKCVNNEKQEYVHERNPSATQDVYTLRRNGLWKLIGNPMMGGQTLQLGERRSYRDPSF